MTPLDIINELNKAITALNKVLLGGDNETIVMNGVVKPSITKSVMDVLNQYFSVNGVADAFLAQTKDGLASYSGPEVYATVFNDAVPSNNGLYVKTNGTWAKAKWDPVEQSKIANLFYAGADKFNVSGFVENDTGKLYSSLAFNRTDFIPVIGGTEYTFNSYTYGNAAMAWFDESKALINTFGSNKSQNDVFTVISPTNARYVVVSCSPNYAKPYFKNNSYDILKVLNIVNAHPPTIPAKNVKYNGGDLSDVIKSIVDTQNIILKNQNESADKAEYATDATSPVFIDTALFTKSTKEFNDYGTMIVTKQSTNTMTVSTSEPIILHTTFVVHNPVDDEYTSHTAIEVNGNLVTVSPDLPASISTAQQMHDSYNGQHMSLYGYKGWADFIVAEQERYAYRKKDETLLSAVMSDYVNDTANKGQISTNGVDIAIPVTWFGGAGYGGWVQGTTNLGRSAAVSGVLNVGMEPFQHLSKAYAMQDGVAGRGFKITHDFLGSNVIAEIICFAAKLPYTESNTLVAKLTNGDTLMKIYNNGVIVEQRTLKAGFMGRVLLDIPNAGVVDFSFEVASSVPTAFRISSLIVRRKSNRTPTRGLFSSGDVIAFLGDSWTQYPIATDIGEVGQAYPIANMSQKYKDMYPNGVSSTGSQWLSRRIQQKLASKGIPVTVLNVGRGGQTSAWAKHWIDSVLGMMPRPTHCFLCFYINDSNGINNASATAYDFDGDKMFSNKTVANGGIDGRIKTYDEWYDNMVWLCERLIANGIKPIVLMPSHTASDSQAQAIRTSASPYMIKGM